MKYYKSTRTGNIAPHKDWLYICQTAILNTELDDLRSVENYFNDKLKSGFFIESTEKEYLEFMNEKKK